MRIFSFPKDSAEPIKPLTYVKIIGQVKTFSGKAHVVAHHVKKMQSLNELIAHTIECVHASMTIRKQGELVGQMERKKERKNTISLFCRSSRPDTEQEPIITQEEVLFIIHNKHPMCRMVLRRCKMLF